MHAPENYACPFCRILADEKEYQQELIIESQHSAAILGLHGHEQSGPSVLIVSKAHFENLYDLPKAQLNDAFELAQQVAKLLKERLHCDGTTLWQHNEPAGNQDVWHFHLHVKARLKGDSLYKKTHYRMTEQERQRIHQTLTQAI